MSIETWENEFYPEPASDAAGSDAEAIAHSLRKWRGLRAENLEKHGLELDEGWLWEAGDSVFELCGENCALCERHYDASYESGACLGCPLVAANGGLPCDRVFNENADDDDRLSPWHSCIRANDPEPMIQLLEQAQANLSK